MAKRRRRRIVRFRWAAGCLGLFVIAWLYGYWVPFPYRPTIVAAARQNHLSPYLVAAVIRVESRFQKRALSQRGAEGLMQIMPTSALWITTKVNWSGKPNLYDPLTNIHLGTWYLHYLLTSYHGNQVLALAAYNGGPETVARWIQTGVLSSAQTRYESIPYPETKNFVRRVQQFEAVYQVMYVFLSFGKHF